MLARLFRGSAITVFAFGCFASSLFAAKAAPLDSSQSSSASSIEIIQMNRDQSYSTSTQDSSAPPIEIIRTGSQSASQSSEVQSQIPSDPSIEIIRGG